MGIGCSPYINQSNGGLMSIEQTHDNPIRTALSGPAAGVSGAMYIADLTNVKKIITLDMGGTSTDMCLVEDNSPRITTSSEILGFPCKLPMTDITTIGAGGGSIAWVDDGGMLKVGPVSAGAYPGPAAYGFGGENPTVTDANIVLHRLNPRTLLGGKMKVDEHAAYKAIDEKVAKPLGINVLDAARGIILVATSNMERAVRLVSVERGYDPREFALIAFGGAGPLFAVEVAKELDINKIIIPCNPGILCALGLLVSDIRSDFVKTNISNLTAENVCLINNNLSEVIDKADKWLDSEKIPQNQRQIIKLLDMRYFGQNYELTVKLDLDKISEVDLDHIRSLFNREHKKEYGYCNDRAQMQIVNYRTIALGKIPRLRLKKREMYDESADKAIISFREVYFEEAKDYIDTPIYDHEKLNWGNRIIGPAIVEQMDSTIIIPPQYLAKVDPYTNIIIANGN